MKCGLVKNYKGKLLPACKEELDSRGKCSVHCRAKLRGDRAGKFCPNFHMKGRRGCRMHGGKSKRGLDNGNAKNLQYSRYVTVMGPRMKEKFNLLMTQANALSLMPDIYAVDLQIEECVGRTSGEGATDWKDAVKAFDDFAVASESKNKRGQIEALTRLGGLLRRGSGRVADLEELRSLQTHRMRLIQAERRNQLEDSVHKGIVFQLIEALVRSVDRNVQDAIAREKIGEDIARLTGATVFEKDSQDSISENN